MKKVRPMIWCPVVVGVGMPTLGLMGFIAAFATALEPNLFTWCATAVILAGRWPSSALWDVGVRPGLYGGFAFDVFVWALVGLGVGWFAEFTRRRKPA